MRDGIIPLSVAVTYFSSSSTIASTVLLILMPFLVTGFTTICANDFS
ncbi:MULTISPECIES: hypothetical protein [Methanobacterium]|nr:MULTISPECIES: hypothetical protein [Methanobacterium]